jgi:hypothetical protein
MNAQNSGLGVWSGNPLQLPLPRCASKGERKNALLLAAFRKGERKNAFLPVVFGKGRESLPALLPSSGRGSRRGILEWL